MNRRWGRSTGPSVRRSIVSKRIRHDEWRSRGNHRENKESSHVILRSGLKDGDVSLLRMSNATKGAPSLYLKMALFLRHSVEALLQLPVRSC